jgi:hypothetical protein
MDELPETAPDVGSTVHCELTAEAVTVLTPLSRALTLATLAVAPPAAAVVLMTPVVTRPATLAEAVEFDAGPPG